MKDKIKLCLMALGDCVICAAWALVILSGTSLAKPPEGKGGGNGGGGGGGGGTFRKSQQVGPAVPAGTTVMF